MPENARLRVRRKPADFPLQSQAPQPHGLKQHFGGSSNEFGVNHNIEIIAYGDSNRPGPAGLIRIERRKRHQFSAAANCKND
jgi:hypothetical protein